MLTSIRSASNKAARRASSCSTTLTRRHGLSTAAAVPSWATYDPLLLGESEEAYAVSNLVNGKWSSSQNRMSIPHPLDYDKAPLFSIPDTQGGQELQPFVDSLRSVSKSGMHNPFKNVERYVQYGEISRLAGNALSEPHVEEFFARSIMACVPKSHAQALGEVRVTAAFLHNFAGDNVRRLAKSFGVPGDHDGQMSVGHRWPFGPVALITPFNFPLEIPVLQLMGALYMGNKPVLKPSEPTSVVMESFLKLLIHCGMDSGDVDFLNCKGPVAQELIMETPVRLTQFTGSSRVSEILNEATKGKVRVEDAGFDWKILGPDVSNVDYVAWQSDQDAYATSGQKCSAQSILFVHENWEKAGLLDKLKDNAAARTLTDLSIGPVLTHTTENFLQHVQNVLEVAPHAKVLFGGQALQESHKIPTQYGAVEPTAVLVPLEEMLQSEKSFQTCAKEIFAPFQIVTLYNDDTLPLVLEACERMSHHLTAAVVSNDMEFQHHVLSHTVNGTTYVGNRARTTGAPQNHWFGPAGDPRGAGIGTPEAIQLVWSCHREIIQDTMIPSQWTQPKAT